MRYISLIFSVILTITFESKALSLDEVINLAKEQTTDVKLSKEDIKQVEAKIRQVKGELFPHLGLSASFNRYDPNYITNFSLKNKYNAAVFVKQPIFDKSIFESLKIAKQNLALKKAILEKVQQEVVYTALEIYEDTLEKKEIFQLQKDSLEYWEKNLILAEEKYKTGFISRYDYTRTKAQCETAKANLIAAKTEFKNSIYQLVYFLKLNQIPNINEPLVLLNLGLPKQEKIKNSPQLKVLQLQRKISLAEGNFYTADLYPKLNARFSYELYNTKDFPSLAEVVRKGYVITLNLNWNIYDGGKSLAKKVESKINAAKYYIQYKDKLYYLKTEYKKQVETLKFLKKQLTALNLNLQAAEEAMKLATERYKNGLASVIEVLEARKNYDEIKKNQLNVIKNYNLGLFYLKKLTGELK